MKLQRLSVRLIKEVLSANQGIALSFFLGDHGFVLMIVRICL